MTLALADQSSLPPLPGWALALAVIAGLTAIAYLFLGPLVHRAPLHDADVSRLDALAGVGRCDQRLCTGPAHFPVTDEAGHSRRVCSSCFQLGWRLGWWVSFADKRPYDQEAAS